MGIEIRRKVVITMEIKEGHKILYRHNYSIKEGVVDEKTKPNDDNVFVKIDKEWYVVRFCYEENEAFARTGTDGPDIIYVINVLGEETEFEYKNRVMYREAGIGCKNCRYSNCEKCSLSKVHNIEITPGGWCKKHEEKP